MLVQASFVSSSSSQCPMPPFRLGSLYPRSQRRDRRAAIPVIGASAALLAIAIAGGRPDQRDPPSPASAIGTAGPAPAHGSVAVALPSAGWTLDPTPALKSATPGFVPNASLHAAFRSPSVRTEVTVEAPAAAPTEERAAPHDAAAVAEAPEPVRAVPCRCRARPNSGLRSLRRPAGRERADPSTGQERGRRDRAGGQPLLPRSSSACVRPPVRPSAMRLSAIPT